MNFFLLAAVALSFGFYRAPATHSAREIYEKCKVRVAQIDSALDKMDVGFTQKMIMDSRGGSSDTLTFLVTIRHGVFKRELVSGTVSNGSRFDAGYDAFDKMFLLSEYFHDRGKILSSCSLEDPPENGDYRIRFDFAPPSDEDDPVNTVIATVNPANFTPVTIHEHIRGLPLGMEFEDAVDVAYDKPLDTYFPGKIEMRIFGKFFFIHGEIGKVTIQNEGLHKL